jgi:two-component sensor histidine kinase
VLERSRQRLRRIWEEGLPPNSGRAYVFALCCIAVTLLARLIFGVLVGNVALFIIYIPAVLISSLVAGASAGGLALVLGGLFGWVGFDWPSWNHPVFTPLLARGVGFAAYLLCGALVVWIADAHRRALRRLRADEAQRLFLMREIQHRSRNTLMGIQSIVSYTLREHKNEAQILNGRIQAFSATNDLLAASANQTAALRDVIELELKAYDEGQVAINGETVILPPQLARALALVFHELAMNAVKHGPLFRSDGRLFVRWASRGERVQIDWIESGGPGVAAIREPGFGTTLLNRVLDPFGGKVETEFRPEGISCQIIFSLPEKNPSIAPATVTAPLRPEPQAGNGIR